MNHWHMNRWSGDEDPCLADTIYGILDDARSELDELSDREHTMVGVIASDVVNPGGRGIPDESAMRDALISFTLSETYHNLMLNAANIVKQNEASDAERAPLYQVDFSRDATADWVYATAKAEADARLYESAKHTVQTINEQSPLGIWECEAELKTWPDEDQMHGGESYCADEYPDGYAGYQDGPCGDYR